MQIRLAAIIITVVTLLMLRFASTCAAVEIEPYRLELDLPPGQTSTTLIKVTNWQDYVVTITAKPDTYRYIFTEQTIAPEGTNTLPSCTDWITIEPNTFDLDPQSSMYLECTIRVPAGATREHVASIMFEEEGLLSTYKEDPHQPGNITLQVVPRFTIPLYVTIQGRNARAAEIAAMAIIEGPRIGTLEANITLHNTGSVHLRPRGTLLFMDSQENIIKTVPIGESLPIFPHYKEMIPVYHPDMFEPGTYTAICTMDIGDGHLVQRKAVFTITGDYELK